MKVVSIAAGLILAAAPLTAQAATGGLPPMGDAQAEAAAGGLFTLGTIPAGAVVVGTTVILAGVAIGTIAATSDDNDGAVSTTSTTN